MPCVTTGARRGQLAPHTPRVIGSIRGAAPHSQSMAAFHFPFLFYPPSENRKRKSKKISIENQKKKMDGISSTISG